MHNFRNLIVWQKSVDLAAMVYETTAIFPKDEKFGMVSQMRRAAVSIASNIAEGSAKTSNKSFSISLETSLGECFELETQVEICKRIGLISEKESTLVEESILEIQRMLTGLKSSISTQS